MEKKKLLLILPIEVHQALREYQIDRAAVDRTTTILNTLIVELIAKGVEQFKSAPSDKVGA
jgi:hypothetical protein